jgi:hypothetical protein
LLQCRRDRLELESKLAASRVLATNVDSILAEVDVELKVSVEGSLYNLLPKAMSALKLAQGFLSYDQPYDPQDVKQISTHIAQVDFFYVHIGLFCLSCFCCLQLRMAAVSFTSTPLVHPLLFSLTDRLVADHPPC